MSGSPRVWRASRRRRPRRMPRRRARPSRERDAGPPRRAPGVAPRGAEAREQTAHARRGRSGAGDRGEARGGARQGRPGFGGEGRRAANRTPAVAERRARGCGPAPLRAAVEKIVSAHVAHRGGCRSRASSARSPRRAPRSASATPRLARRRLSRSASATRAPRRVRGELAPPQRRRRGGASREAKSGAPPSRRSQNDARVGRGGVAARARGCALESARATSASAALEENAERTEARLDRAERRAPPTPGGGGEGEGVARGAPRRRRNRAGRRALSRTPPLGRHRGGGGASEARAGAGGVGGEGAPRAPRAPRGLARCRRDEQVGGDAGGRQGARPRKRGASLRRLGGASLVVRRDDAVPTDRERSFRDDGFGDRPDTTRSVARGDDSRAASASFASTARRRGGDVFREKKRKSEKKRAGAVRRDLVRARLPAGKARGRRSRAA